jgi:hypothetical protein
MVHHRDTEETAQRSGNQRTNQATRQQRIRRIMGNIRTVLRKQGA